MTDVANKDQNGVSTLLAVSSTDGEVVTLYADPTTHRLLTQTAANQSGATAPASTPTFIGQIYVDTTGPDVYIATGTSSSADWTLIFSS